MDTNFANFKKKKGIYWKNIGLILEKVKNVRALGLE